MCIIYLVLVQNQNLIKFKELIYQMENQNKSDLTPVSEFLYFNIKINYYGVLMVKKVLRVSQFGGILSFRKIFRNQGLFIKKNFSYSRESEFIHNTGTYRSPPFSVSNFIKLAVSMREAYRKFCLNFSVFREKSQKREPYRI